LIKQSGHLTNGASFSNAQQQTQNVATAFGKRFITFLTVKLPYTGVEVRSQSSP